MQNNRQTAEKIISQLAGKPVTNEIVTQTEIHREANEELGTVAKNFSEKKENVVTITLVALGYAKAFEGATVQEAYENAISFIESELNEGNLVLADDWDNPAPVDFIDPNEETEAEAEG